MSNSSCIAFVAFRAETLYHIVDILEREAIGELYAWHMYLLETEGAVAPGAVEMSVLVLWHAFAVIVADGILHGSRTVVDGMDELMEKEE